jgi:nitroreductase/NAD-dependent dihydropyrimidine dehydrogenase PreA subunit
MKAITIDPERCTLCGLCVKICVRRILQEQDGMIICTDPDGCIVCGHCKGVCPVDAPQVPSYRAREFAPVPVKEDYPMPDNLLTFFRARRSIRIYKAETVAREKIEKIIQAGRFAPTGGNRQNLEYVVISAPEKITEVRDMTMEILKDQADGVTQLIAGKHTAERSILREQYCKTWQDLYRLSKEGVDKLFYHAPVIIVSHFAALGEASEFVDAGLASMQMVLMAEALGLGTCFIGFLAMAAENSPALKAAMGIPVDHLIPVTFTVGYPGIKFERLVSRRLARVTWI